MKPSTLSGSPRRALRRAVAATACALPLLLGGCKLGPYPDFLEPVDKLEGIEGGASGWILTTENDTTVLVLSDTEGDSEPGTFLWSTVERNTAVVTRVGVYEINGASLKLTTNFRYDLPFETGPITDRIGAQVEEDLDEVEEFDAELTEDTLQLDGVGTFLELQGAVASIDVSTDDGVECLARYLQLSTRTVQSRIRNFGSSGTLIYLDNKTEFVGLLSGLQTIVVENLTDPLTTMSYESFSDYPGLLWRDSFYTDVDINGTGDMYGEARFSIGPDALEVEGDSNEGYELDFAGSLYYGPDNAILIDNGDPVGGQYGFHLELPTPSSHQFEHTLYLDLDLDGCF